MDLRVVVRVVGHSVRLDNGWPEGWPVPREGEPIHIGEDTLYVRTVAWYPAGDIHGDHEPFVYVVLGPQRRQ